MMMPAIRNRAIFAIVLPALALLLFSPEPMLAHGTPLPHSGEDDGTEKTKSGGNRIDRLVYLTDDSFGTFLSRRIPRSAFATLLASHHPAEEPDRQEPSFGSFQYHRIPVSAFPLAEASPRRVRMRKSLTTQPRSFSPPVLATRGRTLLRWDQTAVHYSNLLNRPHTGSATHCGRYGVSIVHLLQAGRFDLESQVGDRNGNHFLARGYAGLDARGGWSVGVGDQRINYGGAGLHGTTARGLQIQHTDPISGSSASWRAGLMIGAAALQHSNLESGIFPRRLETGFVQWEKPRRHRFEGIVYHLADRETENTPATDSVRSVSGMGLSGLVLRKGLDIRGDFTRSAPRFEGGSEQSGDALGIRGTGNLDRVNLSGRIRGSRGAAYEVGPYGILEQTPRLIQDGNLTIRPGAGSSLSAWHGRWRYRSRTIEEGAGTESESHALKGNRWGGRITWRSARSATGLSASRELRRRTLESGSERIATLAASVSQKLHPGINASLSWNQLDYEDRTSYTYLTGSMNLRLGRSGNLTLQQRTFWQEPYGPRLESIADLSSLRLYGDRLSISGRFALTHEQRGKGGFHPAQTQGRLRGDFRLGRTVRLSGSYQLSHSSSGDVHGFDIAFTHSLSRRGGAPPALGIDQIPFDRQIVTGRVYEDRNGDGTWQKGEPGIHGVEVAIDGDSREPVVTDLQGVYRGFLLPGRHSLRLLPASVPIEYTLEGAGRVEVEVIIDRVVEHDFPLTRRVGSVEGHVFDGRPGVGMSGVKVYLGERFFTYTDDEGAFRFLSLPAGDYEVRLDLESLPFGYRTDGPAVVPAHVGGVEESEPCTFRVFRPIVEYRF